MCAWPVAPGALLVVVNLEYRYTGIAVNSVHIEVSIIFQVRSFFYRNTSTAESGNSYYGGP